VAERRFMQPDVLVLAAGGVVGEAWMTGVLAGIEDATGVDFRRVESFVGTSAGSIVAASLAAARSPRRPEGGLDEGAEALGRATASGRSDAAASGDEARPGTDGGDPSAGDEAGDISGRGGGVASPLAGLARDVLRVGAAATAPFVPVALRVGAPAGAMARAALLARAPSEGRSLGRLRREVERWGARFDGRLRVCTVDRVSGRRVVFGAPGAPPAAVAEAVEASCAVPWIFRAVTIGEREYVDGGAWSLTNLDVAPAGRETQVLCLTVTGAAGATASPLGLLRAAARPAATIEALALRQHGAHVQIVSPDAAATEALPANLLDPRGGTAALAAGYAQGLRVASE
jgi:NTE family protein